MVGVFYWRGVSVVSECEKIIWRWNDWVVKQKADGRIKAHHGNDGNQPDSPNAPVAGKDDTTTKSGKKEIRYRY